MSTLLLTTQAALGGEEIPVCTSRSLRLTRYARPTLEGVDRQDYLRRAISVKDQRFDTGLKSWQAWLEQVLPSASVRAAHLLHGRLEARLLINMGGTVLENAGLQLDRFGTAFIPGSAVKACARRTALATLHQWCETELKPDAANGDALATSCASFSGPSDLLQAILRVFGYTDLEWQDYDYEKNKGSDLAWACADQWPALSRAARAVLNSSPGGDSNDETPTRRGSVAFLPAYPLSRPTEDLELDVLTSHHPKYYAGALATATDTENPIPVYFPSVAAQAVYTFVLLPVGKSDTTLLAQARIWLKTGLELFGLGAKTAAGYGYFTDVTAEIAAKQLKAAEDKRRAEEEAAAMIQQAADLAARRAREAALATMTPEQRADAELAARADNWGWMKSYLAKFPDHSPEVQAALLRWFAGGGKERWLSEIKPDAAKGKKPWIQIIGAINAAKKTHNIDLPA